MPGDLAAPILSLPPREQLVVLINGYLLAPLFLIVPLMVSAVLAADAFAGEKERKTLESLLHLPIAERDLFLAKLLTAFIPAIAVSWIGFICFCGVANSVAWPVLHRIFVPTRLWMVMILWVGPAVATLGLAVMVRVSARARTSQEANQLGGAVILPLIFLVGRAVQRPAPRAAARRRRHRRRHLGGRHLAGPGRRQALHQRPARRQGLTDRPRALRPAREHEQLEDGRAHDEGEEDAQDDRGARSHVVLRGVRVTDWATLAPVGSSVVGSGERHLGADPHDELVGGRPLPEAHRQHPVAVRDEADLADRDALVGRGSLGGAHVVAPPQLDAVAEVDDLVGIDVELAVAEVVDPQHLGHDRAVDLAGQGHEPGPQQAAGRSRRRAR